MLAGFLAFVAARQINTLLLRGRCRIQLKLFGKWSGLIVSKAFSCSVDLGNAKTSGLCRKNARFIGRFGNLQLGLEGFSLGTWRKPGNWDML